MNKNKLVSNMKITTYITIFILSFMVISCSIFIMPQFNNYNPFDIKDTSIKYIKGEGVIVSGNDKVRLYNTTTKKIEELPLEEYITGVIAAEMPASYNEEALKAQAVAARTYYFAKRLSVCDIAYKNGGEICNTTHCQVYMTKDERVSKWPEKDSEAYWNKIVSAVGETKGQVLVYDDDIVKYPQFFSTSSGKTENSIDVFSGDIPYLKSTDSPGEESGKKYSEEKEINNKEFADIINKSYSKSGVNVGNIKNKINIVSRTEGGSVKEIALGEVKITGIEFRKIFDLNSANFTLEFGNNSVKIICKGYGHGVGMSQYGANIMGQSGKKYDEILKHYYIGVNIEKVIYK